MDAVPPVELMPRPRILSGTGLNSLTRQPLGTVRGNLRRDFTG